jgi:hypothetical protein
MAAICLAAGPAPRDVLAAYLGAHPYAALQAGAAVYVGTVREYHPTSESTADLHIGECVIDVTQVIRGPTTKSVKLRYVYPAIAPRVASDDYAAWPPLGTLAPQARLLVVAVRAVRQRVALTSSDSTPDDLGASQVHTVSGSDDPVVKAYERMTELFELKGDTLRDGLLSAAADTQPVLHDYAADAATHLSKTSDKVAVMTAVVAHYADPNYPANHATFVIGVLEDAAAARDATEKDRAAAVTSLASVIEGGNTVASGASAAFLNTLISRPGFESPVAFLDAQQLSDLDAAILTLSNARPIGWQMQPAAAIRNWLQKADAAMGPTTRH